MWAKLVEIVETRWNDSQEPTETLARSINTLYGSMYNCHIAFQRFEGDRNQENFASFAFAIDGIISTLQNLHPALRIFDSELAGQLKHYVLGRDRIAAMSEARDLVRSQIRFLRGLVSEEFTHIEIPEEEFAAFGGALERLRWLIRSKLTMDDIFGQ